MSSNSAYLTDSWSSISGLASVAYGFPSFYPEVANQIRAQSDTDFVDSLPPSEIVRHALPAQKFYDSIQEEYNKGEEFANYVDAGGETVSEHSKNLYDKVLSGADQIVSYGAGFSNLLEYSASSTGINFQRLTRSLENKLPDLQLFTEMAMSVGSRKLDKLPPNTRVFLSDSAPLGKDIRGVDLSAGYLTPEQYYSDTAYPGVGNTFDNLPASIMTSLEQGYAGYGSVTPLAGPLSEAVSTEDITNLSSIPKSVFGIGTLNTIRDLTGLGLMSQADQAMYSVDLSELILAKNGYTTYNPLTDSNGDFLDPALITDPALKNTNPDQGLPPTQSSKSSAF